jgi:GntR family transcriptional repressor for pyruvate dehydrogenase complex
MTSIAALRPIPNRRVTQQVQDQLKELILFGVFHPGERLPSERDLAEALGVSRTAIREGLGALQALGLVVIRHGSGVYVSDTFLSSVVPDTLGRMEADSATARDLIEVRLIVEPEIAALAASRATEEDLDRLRHDVEAFRTQLGVIRRPPTDLGFHVDLCKATHNAPLLAIVQWVIQFYAKSGQVPKAKDVLDHERICLAVVSRDPDAARDAMRSHLEWVRKSLNEAMTPKVDRLARQRGTPRCETVARRTGSDSRKK